MASPEMSESTTTTMELSSVSCAFPPITSSSSPISSSASLLPHPAQCLYSSGGLHPNNRKLVAPAPSCSTSASLDSFSTCSPTVVQTSPTSSDVSSVFQCILRGGLVSREDLIEIGFFLPEEVDHLVPGASPSSTFPPSLSSPHHASWSARNSKELGFRPKEEEEKHQHHRGGHECPSPTSSPYATNSSTSSCSRTCAQLPCSSFDYSYDPTVHKEEEEWKNAQTMVGTMAVPAPLEEEEEGLMLLLGGGGEAGSGGAQHHPFIHPSVIHPIVEYPPVPGCCPSSLFHHFPPPPRADSATFTTSAPRGGEERKRRTQDDDDDDDGHTCTFAHHQCIATHSGGVDDRKSKHKSSVTTSSTSTNGDRDDDGWRRWWWAASDVAARCVTKPPEHEVGYFSPHLHTSQKSCLISSSSPRSSSSTTTSSPAGGGSKSVFSRSPHTSRKRLSDELYEEMKGKEEKERERMRSGKFGQRSAMRCNEKYVSWSEGVNEVADEVKHDDNAQTISRSMNKSWSYEGCHTSFAIEEKGGGAPYAHSHGGLGGGGGTAAVTLGVTSRDGRRLEGMYATGSIRGGGTGVQTGPRLCSYDRGGDLFRNTALLFNGADYCPLDE